MGGRVAGGRTELPDALRGGGASGRERVACGRAGGHQLRAVVAHGGEGVEQRGVGAQRDGDGGGGDGRRKRREAAVCRRARGRRRPLRGGDRGRAGDVAGELGVTDLAHCVRRRAITVAQSSSGQK